LIQTNPVESKIYNESESSIVKERLVSFIQDETQPEAVVVAAFRHDLKDGELKVIYLLG
jgi:hypothetical protein